MMKMVHFLSFSTIIAIAEVAIIVVVAALHFRACSTGVRYITQ